MCLERRSRFF